MAGSARAIFPVLRRQFNDHRTGKSTFTAASAATLKFSGIKLLEINANANVSHRIAILRDGISEMKKATQ